MKQRFGITISGTKAGGIWWPSGALCSKDFDYRVREDESLRDAILSITNDGDFQSCNIVDATVIATLYKNNRRITRYFDIRSPLFPSIADCILSETSEEYEQVIFASCEEQ